MAASNLPTLQKVTINGVDVSSYVAAFEVEEIFDRTVRTASVGLKNTVSAILDYQDATLVGSIITIERGVSSATEKTIFKGYVRKLDFEGGKVVVNCEDMLSEAKYVVVNTSYDSNIDTPAGVIDAIVRDLIDNNTTGLSYTAGTTIQDSGTLNIVKKFVLKQRILMDALSELAFLLDWQLYYNSEDDKVYFEPKGFTSSSTVLSTTTNIVQLPKWNIDSKDMFNRIVVQGQPQEIFTETDSILLDGSTTGWTTTSVLLPKKPNFVKVYSDTSNPPTTEKIGGIENSTTTFDYEVNREKSLIEWNTDNFAPTTSFYALVEYSYNEPINVVRKNQSSIDNYGLKSISQQREDIKTRDDAERWALSQLNTFAEPFFSTDLSVRSLTDLQIGNIYTVQDTVQNVERELMIKAIRYRFPYRYDEVVVADREWRTANWGDNAEARIKRLEERQSDSSDILSNFIDLNRDIRYERRETRVQKVDRSGQGVNVFILGSTQFGVLGTNELGDDGSAVTTTEAIIPGKNTFKEFVYDDNYYDSGNSVGVTWNTTNKDITITDTLYSELIALGVSYTHFTVTFGSIVGDDYTVEISGDNKSTWQTVTAGARTAFTSSNGTGIYFRITNNTGAGWPTAFGTWGEAVSDVVIDNTYNSFGDYLLPAISIALEE